jgi:hypothetical protein
MVKRKSKKPVARKVKRRTAARKAAPRKMKRGYAIHAGKPTGREVQAMQRLQSLTERCIAEGLTPADARTRATEELRATQGLANWLSLGWPAIRGCRAPPVRAKNCAGHASSAVRKKGPGLYPVPLCPPVLISRMCYSSGPRAHEGLHEPSTAHPRCR